MATNTYINKVTYGGETLVDMTGNTAVPGIVLSGYRFQTKTGQTVAGTFLKNLPTSFTFNQAIYDSDGSAILDSDNASITGQVIYTRS